jgi:hypothetical protein
MRKELTVEGKARVKKIMEKLYTLSQSIEEEFDIMELVEDSIRDIFKCNLDCATCSSAEQGECMQSFRKTNLYLLRKLYLDEVLLKEFTQDILDMINLVAETRNVLETEKTATENETKENYKKKFEEIKKKSEEEGVKEIGFYI